LVSKCGLLGFQAPLPNFYTGKVENAQAKWLVGWSRGKEKLKDGRFDTLKGSFYVNCSPDFADTIVQSQLAEKYPDLPEYTASNIWPSEQVLPGFEKAFRDLCTLIIDTAVLVARACDRYALEKIEGYQKGYLEHVVKTSHVSKARLLHYFPPPEKNFGVAASDEDDWCATHIDHGCLTGLTSAMFVDEAANPSQISKDGFSAIPELDGPPDPQAGLYIRSRSDEVVKVSVPRDCLAFQTGEALEVITKGKFKAVPHFVRGASHGKGGAIARNTLAVFTQPNLWEMIDENRDFATFAMQIVEKNH
jgi:isopenicillin N synthase-like dioxygenase